MERSAMTQEELDALMAGEIDLDEESVVAKLPEEESEAEDPSSVLDEDKQEGHFRVDASSSWPPPPPTADHQVVNQLDDVTKDSEAKATEVFDKLESISEALMQIENLMSKEQEVLENNIDIFERLSGKFSEIESFKVALEENKSALSKAQEIVDCAQSASDEVMMTMDVMQYQDIHRQKIERVINVMRTLSAYMSSLFDSKIDDSVRVKTAVHIAGDERDDIVNEDDIEALIASFGK